MAKAEEPFTLAGIPIYGAEAQIGRLVSDNIKYEMVMKQLKKLHYIPRDAWKCKCGEMNCPTLSLILASGL